MSTSMNPSRGGLGSPKESTKNKQSEIANVLRDLAAKQHPKNPFEFPELMFTPQSWSGYTDNEDATATKT